MSQDMTDDAPAAGTPSDEERDEASVDPEVVQDVALVLPAAAYETLITAVEITDALTVTTAAPASHTETRTIDAVKSLGEHIDRRFDDLKNQFDREIRAEATREKVVDRLHSELQEYKQDLLLNVLRPVFIDMIQLHDDIGKVAVAPLGTEGDGYQEARRLVGLMEGFQQGIEDVLYRQGVEPFQSETDTFDPKRQRAVATVATDDPELNKTIAARHRKGFRAGDRVIRPEIVSVYALKK
jgi:molecular chaperone GrpE